MSKKRGLSLSSHHHHHQNASDNWNPKSWNWDSSRFVAKPLRCDGVQNIDSVPRKPDQTREDVDILRLNLGGGDGNGSSGVVGPDLVSRPNKRLRSGSPVGANYPMCQVDDCKEDLCTAKDYHRRHKVCEVHSKASKALVGKQMQRFCQQCSRFHLLSEFDEGKRSCRRRLAGHNRRRRRRKSQPEETIRDNDVTNDILINLLAVVSCAKGNSNGRNDELPTKDHLIQILSKINSLPLNESVANDNLSSEDSEQNNTNPSSSSSPSTMDFLAVLSKGSDSVKTNSPCVDQEASRSLFSPSPDGGYISTNKLPLDINYLSFGSSSNNHSPLSSPPDFVHDLFPTQTSREETIKDARLLNGVDYVKSRTSNGCGTSLQLFGSSTENDSDQSFPCRDGYISYLGSDHSPSGLNSDPQEDRTGRILFKLFDKDPAHLPDSLRAQIYNWLSNSPSEMESYIRPGCVVLSVYLSMPSSVWDQLEENILNYVKSLVKDIDDEFWGNARFLIHTDRQIASHKEGKIRLYKSWRDRTTPELISVSPLAVVGGQETFLLLKGRNLTAPGTTIHCTHSAGYNILSSCQDTAYDEITLNNFKVYPSASSELGRFFIEVENKSRTASFPIIIADDTICQELRLLEPEINNRTTHRDVLHFLNELGWLFQRKRNCFLFGIPDYKLTRFKFLLIFSVEHDFCALVKTLLGILLELNVRTERLVRQSQEMLSEIQLLNRAVKKRCRGMVELLVNYSITDPIDNSEKNFLFVPNMAGPGGVTPLHLAACTSSSDDIVDALTNDPKEVGLFSWNSVVDANGISPYAYALMTNNHSYNFLVARKLADKENCQISVSIKDETELDKKPISRLNIRRESCSRCAVIASRGYNKKFPGLLQRSYIHSMLLVAAVCVCVCLFLRSRPYVKCDLLFAWEKLDYGAI